MSQDLKAIKSTVENLQVMLTKFLDYPPENLEQEDQEYMYDPQDYQTLHSDNTPYFSLNPPDQFPAADSTPIHSQTYRRPSENLPVRTTPSNSRPFHGSLEQSLAQSTPCYSQAYHGLSEPSTSHNTPRCSQTYRVPSQRSPAHTTPHCSQTYRGSSQRSPAHATPRCSQTYSGPSEQSLALSSPHYSDTNPEPFEQSAANAYSPSGILQEQSSSNAVPQYLVGSLIPGSLITAVKMQSCSRSNFAVNLVRRLFTTEERKNSNVRGVLGKKKLNPEMMLKVREATFQLFPCDTMENESHVWTYCCKAIDESCRRLNRPGKENKYVQF